MSQLTDYLIGQVLQKMQSLESEQHKQKDQIKHLAEKVDEALTWAQRLVWLGLALVGAIGINYSPEKVAEVLASLLKAHR
jgi:p-aminobenzoyl-glutamate transporter AbgT